MSKHPGAFLWSITNAGICGSTVWFVTSGGIGSSGFFGFVFFSAPEADAALSFANEASLGGGGALTGGCCGSAWGYCGGV
jgi:hypothetical protein